MLRPIDPWLTESLIFADADWLFEGKKRGLAQLPFTPEQVTGNPVSASSPRIHRENECDRYARFAALCHSLANVRMKGRHVFFFLGGGLDPKRTGGLGRRYRGCSTRWC